MFPLTPTLSPKRREPSVLVFLWGSLSPVGEGWSEAIRQHLMQFEITFHFIQTPVPIDITFQIPFVKTVTPFRAYAQKMADA
jgi:hypothetical protein